MSRTQPKIRMATFCAWLAGSMVFIRRGLDRTVKVEEGEVRETSEYVRRHIVEVGHFGSVEGALPIADSDAWARLPVAPESWIYTGTTVQVAPGVKGYEVYLRRKTVDLVGRNGILPVLVGEMGELLRTEAGETTSRLYIFEVGVKKDGRFVAWSEPSLQIDGVGQKLLLNPPIYADRSEGYHGYQMSRVKGGVDGNVYVELLPNVARGADGGLSIARQGAISQIAASVVAETADRSTILPFLSGEDDSVNTLNKKFGGYRCRFFREWTESNGAKMREYRVALASKIVHFAHPDFCEPLEGARLAVVLMRQEKDGRWSSETDYVPLAKSSEESNPAKPQFTREFFAKERPDYSRTVPMQQPRRLAPPAVFDSIHYKKKTLRAFFKDLGVDLPEASVTAHVKQSTTTTSPEAAPATSATPSMKDLMADAPASAPADAKKSPESAAKAPKPSTGSEAAPAASLKDLMAAGSATTSADAPASATADAEKSSETDEKAPKPSAASAPTTSTAPSIKEQMGGSTTNTKADVVAKAKADAEKSEPAAKASAPSTGSGSEAPSAPADPAKAGPPKDAKAADKKKAKPSGKRAAKNAGNVVLRAPEPTAAELMKEAVVTVAGVVQAPRVSKAMQGQKGNLGKALDDAGVKPTAPRKPAAATPPVIETAGAASDSNEGTPPSP